MTDPEDQEQEDERPPSWQPPDSPGRSESIPGQPLDLPPDVAEDEEAGGGRGAG